MENIDNASEISDISHIKKVCQLLEVIHYVIAIQEVSVAWRLSHLP